MKGEGLKVRGMPWWPGEAKEIKPDNLTARILCQRHNSALSPLDAAAERAFRSLGDAIAHASRKSLARRTHYSIISGEGLELWAMKTMAGVAASGIDFRLGEHRVQDFKTPMDEIVASLTAPQPISRVTLSVPMTLDLHEATLGRRAVSLGPMLDPATRTNKGLIVRMHGLTLDFGFDLEPPAGAAVRPDIIDIVGQKRSARVYVGWGPTFGSGTIAEIRLGAPQRSNAGRQRDEAGVLVGPL